MLNTNKRLPSFSNVPTNLIIQNRMKLNSSSEGIGLHGDIPYQNLTTTIADNGDVITSSLSFVNALVICCLVSVQSRFPSLSVSNVVGEGDYRLRLGRGAVTSTSLVVMNYRYSL